MYQQILVPVDGSPTSRRGLDEAIAIAKLTGGQLRLIHVVDELSFVLAQGAYVGSTGDLLDILREAGAQQLAADVAIAQAAGVQVSRVLCDSLAGSVTDLVTLEAQRWPADLIVLGTHGRRGIARAVMGSSAEGVLRHATVPVLLVRAAPVRAPVSVSPLAGALAGE